MGELESLLLVLTVLYLAECVVWVRRGLVAFVNPWFPAAKRWRVWHPGTTVGNPQGAPHLANPLPPLGSVIIGQQFPISLSPQAALAHTGACLNPTWRPRQTERLVDFDDMQSLARDGRKVLINDALFVKASSPFTARRIVNALREIKALPSSKRADAIGGLLRASFDIAAGRERLRSFQGLNLPIRFAGNSLFVILYLIAPAVVWRFGLSQWIWLLVAGILAHTVTIALLFRRAHGLLYPGSAEERFAPFLTMLLAPSSAIRAVDVLSKPLLEEIHALAAAHVLLQPAAFREFARHVLLDLRHPILPACPATAEMAVRTEHWFREATREAAEQFVKDSGLDLEVLLAPAAPAEQASTAYCARCGAQFINTSAFCADCGDRPVQQWA